MNENLLELEHYLILCLSNDQNEINSATQYIFNVCQLENAQDIFISLISNSNEPIAINQAAIQAFCIFRTIINTLTNEQINNYSTIFINFLNQPKYDKKSKEHLSPILNFLLQHIKEPSQELIDFLSQLPTNLTQFHFNIATSSVHILNADVLNALFENFGIAILSALQNSEWEIKLCALRLFTELISFTTEIFGEIFAILPSLLPDLANQSDSIQSTFLIILEHILKVFPDIDGMVDSIIEFSQSETGFPAVSIFSINCLRPYISEFSDDQINSILEILILQYIRLVQSENILTENPSDFIEDLLKAFPHPEIYEIIKSKLQDCINSDNNLVIAAGIVLLIPVLNSAPEAVSGQEIPFFLELIQKSFSSESDPEICKASCMLFGYLYSIDAIAPYLFRFIEPLVSFLGSQDLDLVENAIHALDWVLDINQTLNEPIVLFLFNSRNEIQPKIFNNYLICLQKAILSTKVLSSELCSLIFEFISSNLIISDPNLTEECSISLRLFASLLSKDDTLAQHLQSLTQSIILCLNSEEFDCFNTLVFLSTISEVAGVNITEYLIQFVPIIKNIIENRKGFGNLRFRTAVSTLCKMIRYSLVPELEYIIKRLRIMLNSKRQSDVNESLLDLKYLVKLCNDKIKMTLIKKLLNLAYETESEEILSSLLITLSKFVKYPPEDNTQMMADIAQLCINFSEGSLTALEGQSFLSSVIFAPLLQDFADFCAVVCSKVSSGFEEISMIFVPLLETDLETNISAVMSVFAGVLENENITESFITEIAEYLPVLMNKAQNTNAQHDIVFIINRLLQKMPGYYPEIQQILLPTIISWFETAKQNSDVFATVLSNIASLLIHFATLDQTFNNQLIEQALEFYPPVDETECSDMSIYLITLVSSRNLTPNMICLIAKGIATVLTSQHYILRKYHISEEVFLKLKEILLSYCQDENILNHIRSAFAQSVVLLSRFESLLQN